MGRPSKPPRLELRGQSFYIVDGPQKLACGTRERYEAEQKLAEYLAGKASRAAAQRKAALDASVAGMLAFYEADRLDRLRRKVNAKTYKQTYQRLLTEGVDPAEAHPRADQAARAHEESVESIGNDRFTLANLKTHLGNLPAWQLKQEVINDYAEARRQQGVSRRSTGETVKRLSDGTIDKELNILRAAIALAFERDPIKWFRGGTKPTFTKPTYLPSAGRIRFLTKAEAARLIAGCHLPHIRLLFRIMLSTGARRGAVEELRWEQVDFTNNFIDFGVVEAGNAKRRPLIQMAPELRRELWNAHQVACSAHVVEFRGKAAGNTKKSVKAALVKAGLANAGDSEDAVGHTLKHTFVTWMLAAGRSWEEISLINNTTVGTLRRKYGHLDRVVVGRLAEAVALDDHLAEHKLEWHPATVTGAIEELSGNPGMPE